MSFKGSGAQRRKLLRLEYEKEKEEAKRNGLPPPEPPRRKSGALRKRERRASTGPSTRAANPPSTIPEEGGAGASTQAPAPSKDSADRKEGRLSQKRLRNQSSDAEPSPKNAPKRRKEGGDGDRRGQSYAALASDLPKVMVTVGETLGERMPISVFEEIKGGVVDQILEFSGKGPVPRFKDTVLQSSRIVFIYEDEASAGWLRRVVPTLRLAPRCG